MSHLRTLEWIGRKPTLQRCERVVEPRGGLGIRIVQTTSGDRRWKNVSSKQELMRRSQKFKAGGAMRVISLILVLTIVLGWSGARAALCSVSATAMNLGSYSGSATTPGPTPITVNCFFGVAWNVAVNAGQHSGGNYNWNAAGPSGSLINYSLYRDAGHTQLEGGTSGYDTISGTGTGSSQIVYIYPMTAANPAVVPGSYSDSVTVSLYNVGGTITTTMAVTATVAASCSISAAPLIFGAYTGALINTTTQLNVTCTNMTAYSANMDQGLHYSSFYHPRMIGPNAALLSYLTYRDSARTQLWGNTANYDGVTGTGSGYAQALTVYAQLPASQYVSPGSYSDTITVTINY